MLEYPTRHDRTLGVASERERAGEQVNLADQFVAAPVMDGHMGNGAAR